MSIQQLGVPYYIPTKLSKRLRCYSSKSFKWYRSKTKAEQDSKINLTKLTYDTISCTTQKQPSRGILRKRCSENMQLIYRRTNAARSVTSAKLQSNFIVKLHFGMGLLLYICCIFSEHLFKERLWRAASTTAINFRCNTLYLCTQHFMLNEYTRINFFSPRSPNAICSWWAANHALIWVWWSQWLYQLLVTNVFSHFTFTF